VIQPSCDIRGFARPASIAMLFDALETGKIKIGDTMLDSPNEREIARQERMKREG